MLFCFLFMENVFVESSGGDLQGLVAFISDCLPIYQCDFCYRAISSDLIRLWD